MNRISTQVSLFIAFVLVSCTPAFSQPDYTFKNAVLVSGNSLAVNAVYKFANVKSGVDARVTIKGMTGGITLTSIDDNSTGFDEAFQPLINVATKSNGYVEFRVDFVTAGTTTLKTQTTVPVTCIGVEGTAYHDGVLNEQDQVQYFPGYYNYTLNGTSLKITNPSGWVVTRNSSGLTDGRIDTTAKGLMSTVVNKNISGFLIRIGAVNTSAINSGIRNSSVYFREFKYPSPELLPNRTLIQFSGSEKQNTVELKGVLSASHSYNKIVIERGNSSSSFLPIAELPLDSYVNSGEYPFTYLDRDVNGGVYYYRIHLLNSVTLVQEISNTLVVKMNESEKDLRVCNTILQSGNPVLTVNSASAAQVTVQATDLSGHIMYNNNAQLNAGTNDISMPGVSAAKGYIVIVIRDKNKTTTKKAFVQ